MLSGKRIALGIGVLGLGLCAALPFQQQSGRLIEATPEAASGDLVLRPTDAALEVSLPSDSSPAVGLPDAGRASRTEQGASVRRPASLEGVALPEMPAVYPAEPASLAAPLANLADLAGDGGRWLLPTADGETSVGAEPRRHRVADGDTLQNLAERYWGRSDRYLDLFEANRDTLTRPDVLPIGAEIVIPPLSATLSPGQSPLLPILPPHEAPSFAAEVEAARSAPILSPAPPGVLRTN